MARSKERGGEEQGGEGGRRERREHPQSPILPLGAHPLEWIRAEQCALNEWDPKSQRRKTNHQWEREGGRGERRGRDGERDRGRWREKRRPLKRCPHKATKHLGTCRARQVEIETKLPLYLLAGGWLGVKDFNAAAFTSEPFQYIDRAM